ncbi:hypothetical protein O6P43_034270 [Quillaja saponaria]|uniref:Uncharacterized protein n=1 Tax=Quillaja saponaria TaxID=32244 RepID=A0AAD7KTM8_QUISA|nr:hypothetical protein O6P43_034270 [Quillaja saponaria]
MRGAATILSVKNKFKQICPVKGSWGIMATSTPKKPENSNSGEGGLITTDKTNPIVTFSRPPPLPLVLGPLAVFSLLETSSSNDGDDK